MDYFDVKIGIGHTPVDFWYRYLSPKEREIIALRYGLDGTLPRTLEEVGRAFGVTRERIRQIEAKALEKLRTFHLQNYTPPNQFI